MKRSWTAHVGRGCALSVGELRSRLGLDRGEAPPNAHDVAAFLGWLLVSTGLAIVALAPAVLLVWMVFL